MLIHVSGFQKMNCGSTGRNVILVMCVARIDALKINACLKDGAGPTQEVLRGLVGVVLRLYAEPVALIWGQLELVAVKENLVILPAEDAYTANTRILGYTVACRRSSDAIHGYSPQVMSDG